MRCQSHRIHGAAIYGNMDPINIPPMLALIYHTWILWECLPHFPIGSGEAEEKPGLPARHRRGLR